MLVSCSIVFPSLAHRLTCCVWALLSQSVIKWGVTNDISADGEWYVVLDVLVTTFILLEVVVRVAASPQVTGSMTGSACLVLCC